MTNNFTIEDVRAFWDSVSDAYEPSNKKVGYVHYQRYEAGTVYLDLRTGQKVLNIWSRMGSCIPYIRKHQGIELYNREASLNFLEVAKKRYPHENFGLTDLEDLSEFKNNFFDRIISLETLEHVPKPLVFLKELNRIMKPKGILVMSLPPKGAELTLKVYETFFENHGEGPHEFLSPGTVKNLLEQSGFELIKHVPNIILPLGNDKLERFVEKVLTGIFGKTPLANFGIRHFYICKKIQ